jgi:DNA-binding beta-propeller fold protein YncE
MFTSRGLSRETARAYSRDTAAHRESASTIVPGSRIFISYRHADSAGYAGRLYDRLKLRYGDEQIFMDLEMDYGIDFVERIDAAVSSCAVMLVMIGPGWLNARDEAEKRRLDDSDDFVRIEVSSALVRSTRVIPILVGDATMPGNDELPPELKALARRNALELSDSRWEYDVGRLVQTVDGVINAREEQVAEQPKAMAAAPSQVVTPPRPAVTRPRAAARASQARESEVVDPEPALEPARSIATRRPSTAMVAVAVVAALVLVGVVVLLAGGGDDGGSGGSPSTVALGRTTGPSAIAVDPTTKTLWVAEQAKGAVAQVQISGLKRKDVFGLPAGAAPSRVVIGGSGIVWLSDPFGHRVIRVDMASGKSASRTIDGMPRGIVADAGSGLFIADSAKDRVIRIGAADSSQQTWQLPSSSPRSIVLGEPGIVWVSDPKGGQIIRLDTRDGSTTPVQTGGSPEGLARDPATGKIWVADSERGQVIRVGRENTSQPFTQRSVGVGDGPASVAIDSGIIWVANVGAGTVTRLSHKFPYRRLGPDIQVGGRLAGIAAMGTKAWVTNADDGTVSELSSAAG